ncbi:MAG TPA: tripartite tricarboxylate transporter substrate binding protein [Hyphomicrobiaceae bacterium]|jgi:tripartite-type tricarboxylate transporter receptor subunit TctC|nr:tripartite tricarboxylate transporter substrate binding protein [Hyphomicrobiaceae bacterium]
MKPIVLTLLPVLGLGLAMMEARAETWPTKPLKAIVPVGAGSTTDIIPRIVFEQLSAQLGQGIVVENRVGAGGTIGSAFVAKADPDGYTVLAHGSALTISPALYPNLGYDPARDLIAVVPFGVSPNVLVVPPARGWKTVGDLVAAAKAKPDGLNFSSVGVGTATHLSAERFRASSGIEAVHVPFKGGAEAMTEVIAGRIDFFFGPVALVLPQVQEGKLSALAVNGAKRSAALPNVPTTLEAGFADVEYPIWLGMFLPAKTARDIVDKLNRETLTALREPKVRDKLATLGFELMVMTPAEFAAHVEKEISINAALVKAAGIKPH